MQKKKKIPPKQSSPFLLPMFCLGKRKRSKKIFSPFSFLQHLICSSYSLTPPPSAPPPLPSLHLPTPSCVAWGRKEKEISYLIVVVCAEADSVHRVVFHQQQRVTPNSMWLPGQLVKMLACVAQLNVIGLQKAHAAKVDHVDNAVGCTCCHGCCGWGKLKR